MIRRFRMGLVLALLPSLPAHAQEPPLQLADLEAQVERQHPAIRAAEKMAEAKRARVAQARGWPDPQVSLGYMGDAAPFKTQAGDPASYRLLGVMQPIPFFGKRDLRAKVAAKEADEEQWSIEAARRRVLSELRQAYYELWAVDAALAATARNKDLLDKLTRIAEERYKVGGGLQQDVLRAQVEVTRLLQRLALLRQRRGALEAQLNSLLLRPPETPVGPLAPLEKSALTHSLEQLSERALADHPELRRLDERTEQGRYAAALARREFRPDFSLGWDYLNRPGMPEMYGLRVSVNVPLFNRAQRRAAVSEAEAMQESARHMRNAVRAELLFRVREQYLAARASDELLTLTARGMLPQSRLALESALAGYQTGLLDFLNVLSSFATVLDNEVSYAEELARYQKALARLEETTGVRLTAPPAPPAGAAAGGK